MSPVFAEHKSIDWMTSYVVQEMQQSLEVLSSWTVHVTTGLADSKQFFRGRVCKIIQGSNGFDAAKAAFRFQLLDFRLGLGVVILCPFEIMRQWRTVAFDVIRRWLKWRIWKASPCNGLGMPLLVKQCVTIRVLTDPCLETPVSSWRDSNIKSS